MPGETLDRVEFPARKAVVATYSGPKSGLGQATKTMYGWVGTYFKDRIPDIYVCLDERPAPGTAGDQAVHVNAEIRLEVDDHFSDATKLPEGLTVRKLPPEATIARRYTGPMPGFLKEVLPWMEEMAKQHNVAPGYRQRMVVMAKDPMSPDWEVEVELVLR